MFPPSLHKNIRELDKQITLLESECENMEANKRKKSTNGRMSFTRPVTQAKKSAKDEGERPFITGPRVADSAQVRRTSRPPSVVKLCQKSTYSAPKKQITSREVSETNDEQKNSKHPRSCHVCGNDRVQLNCKKEKRVQEVKNCVCGRELKGDLEKTVDVYVTHDKQNDSDGSKQILHKGILHANPGGTIEVTVTQKQSKTSISACKRFTDKKNGALPKESDGELNKLKEPLSAGKIKNSTKEQKWSEILGHETDSISKKNCKRSYIKNNEIKSNYSSYSKYMDQFESHNGKCMPVKDVLVRIPSSELHKFDEEQTSELWNDENECPRSAVSSLPKESRHKIPLKRKNLENVIDASPRMESCGEKDCIDDEATKSVFSEESLDPLLTLCNLLDALRGNITEDEAKRLFSELELTLQKKESSDTRLSSKGKVEDGHEGNNQNNDYVKKLQRHFLSAKKLCQKLIKERDKLTENMALKDKLLLNECTKEKDYLSTIADLKANLEREKENNIAARKELICVQNKLLNETKVVDALRQSHAKMQEQIQKCLLENDKLKTEIRLNKLESQKFNVLLAGKDVEIKRYKDEVESFQKQITEQLAALRANSAANEVQKAMEAIIQHSQAFSVTDLDSAFSETQTDEKMPVSGSKHRERLIHSSPTSTKSSTLDSSWNHISSIHEDDANIAVLECTADETDGVLVQGGRKALEDHPEKVSSFVSCKSLDDSLTSQLDKACGSPKVIAPITTNSRFRKEIKDLFQDLKNKCSRKMNSVSSESVFLDNLLMSDVSELSDFSDTFLEACGMGRKKL